MNWQAGHRVAGLLPKFSFLTGTASREDYLDILPSRIKGQS